MRPLRSIPRRWALLAGALAFALIAAHLALNSGWAAEKVRSRARDALARHFRIELGSQYAFGWLGEVRIGPLKICASDGEEALSVEEIRVRPSLLGILIGRLEPARVTLSGLTVHTDAHGTQIRELVDEMESSKSTSHAGAHRGSLPQLALENARFKIERAGESPLEIGPFDARVSMEHDAGARIIDAKLSVLRGRAKLHGRIAADGVWLHATADELPIAHLVPSGDDVPIAVGSGLLTGKLELTGSGAASMTAKLDAHLSELVVAGARIADEPVGPLELGYRGTLQIDLAGRTLATTDSTFWLGHDVIEFPFDGSFAVQGEPTFDVDVRLGPVNLQQITNALPAQLAPARGESREPAGEGHGAGRVLLEPPHFDGAIRAEIRASGPLRRPDDWTVGVRLDSSGLRSNARDAPFALREPFEYKPRDAAGVERTIVVGPRNPSYVPLDSLPPIVAAAVITSEDGNFYKHDGFDFDEIRDSIATAAEGQRLRGGSTLTQQLVKNLYLSRERTLARKLREALITLQIEAALPKARILEIYLNIIEWGPGVYGIGEAAHYYFGVDARHLTPKQAVFLATIIPNPIKYSVYFRKGATSRNWDEHMAHLIEKLRERGDLDEAQYEKALADPVVFRARETASAHR